MKLLFIRHGETEINVKKLTHKTGDSALLTSRGKEQIQSVLPRLREYKVERVFSSPEARARETAAIISNELKLSLKVINDLCERDWGEWEGKPWEEIKQVLDKKSVADRYEFIPPQGESWRQMEARLQKALSIITSGKEKAVCIVTHAGAMRGLIPILKNSEKEESLKHDFENASIIIFEHKDGIYKEVQTK